MAKRKVKEKDTETLMSKLVDHEKYPNDEFLHNGAHPPTINYDKEESTDKNKMVRQRVMRQIMKSFRLPPVDFQDVDAVNERLYQFFREVELKGVPVTFEMLALAMGVPSNKFKDYREGRIASPSAVRESLQKAVDILASLDGQLALEQKYSSVAYIFRAKNFYGMSNEDTVIHEHRDSLGERRSDKELEDIYSGTIIDAEFEEREK